MAAADGTALAAAGMAAAGMAAAERTVGEDGTEEGMVDMVGAARPPLAQSGSQLGR
jgi:hypothetical protein